MAMQEECCQGYRLSQTEPDDPTKKSALPLVALAPRGLVDRKLASEFFPSSDDRDRSRLGLNSQLDHLGLGN